MDHSMRSIWVKLRLGNLCAPKAAKTPVPTRTPRRTATPGNYTFLGNIPRDPNPPTKSTPLPIVGGSK